MKKDMVKGIVVGLAGGLILAGGSAYAAGTYVKAQLSAPASYVLNGKQLSTSPRLVYQGTSYVQLYSIQHALQQAGLGATWDGSKNPGVFSITTPNGTTAANPISYSDVIVKSDGAGGTEVDGLATNNSTQTHSFFIVVSFFDANGKLLGVANGAVNDIEPGQSITWQALANGDYTNAASNKVETQDLS
ncbi:hypothetical protein JI721_15145 [Alicyclobacillus cycloheptanicus]|uniref:Copper amine oxidase N-terminal domain-containing protein n=1 Tax=Alicyclobacillus cycloheptanicus TaxID=1457 RepID=A0ABT9XDA2_9BACL|nr:FxLYD domain-containing protein [Alicyclobacillus cycloheptanicus]MDQ0188275.1 hypothetical protein [Alicyclobacillus cycloheptanicus]WDM00994.1 hypothetical protein JI721_15145 [Alicyclobacillus cycloheptanicus]